MPKKHDWIGVAIGAGLILLGIVTMPAGIFIILIGVLTVLLSFGYKGAGLGALQKAGGA
jgi:hypothetical protein